MLTPASTISLAGVFFPRKKFDGLHSWFRVDLRRYDVRIIPSRKHRDGHHLVKVDFFL